jgi:3-(3-hydroxy-phenyl)propionate hydroxylase
MDYALPIYAFTPPPELSNTCGAVSPYPVVILGGGLTGLTLLCDLLQRGVKAILLDEDNTVGVRGASSRGICYAQKSLEIFKRLGIYERIKAKGIEWSVGRTFAGVDEVYSFDLAAQSTHNASAQPPFINIQQFYIEWYLVERILEIAPHAIRWKNKLTAISQNDDGVTLTVETPAGSYTCGADYVVDCTGASSFVRAAMGVAAPRATGVDRWCITDVKFKHHPPKERWTWIKAPFNDDRCVWQHLMADDVWRLDYQMSVDDDPEYVSRRDVVEERLRKHFGDDVEFELVWVGPYSYRDLLAETFRKGRVFFAGDAAHVMSPFGARGGNSGVQDADNLGWKLSLVLQGNAHDALLTSYHDERREAAQVNITVTARTNRFLTPRSRAEHWMRNAVIDLARTQPFARALVNTGRLSVASTYTRSPLNLGRGAGRSIQNVRLETKEDLSGFIMRFGGRTLVVANSRENDPNCAAGIDVIRLEKAFPVRFVVLRETTSDIAQQLHLRPGELGLIRPDLHFAGAIPAAQIATILKKMFGKQSP